MTKFIKELAENTSPAYTDAVEIDDGTNSEYVTLLNLLNAAMPGGWIPVTGSWTYASASTITIPSDGTTTYSPGDKIRWKQGGAFKYAYLTVVAATLLTVNGGTDYTVANSAITDVAYSKSATPLGFPIEFNFAPALTNVTVGNGTLSAKFSWGGGAIQGHVDLEFGSTTSIAGGPGFTLPIPVTSYTIPASSRRILGRAGFLDAGTAVYVGDVGTNGSSTAGDVRVGNSTGTYDVLTVLSSTIPFTWTTGDSLGFSFTYTP